ncbi:hypothetical protein L1065_10835 [Nereida sp. MMG024]|nr:hypothetical protein [Nereida sp. MMG025]
MVEIADIVDGDSFKAWLNAHIARVGDELGRQHAVWLASRCAARVMPFAMETALSGRIAELTPVLMFRVTSISGVASVCPTPEIARTADAAAFAADAAPDAADAAAAAAAFAAFAAAAAAAAVFAAYASARAAAAAPDIYEYIQVDCAALLASGDIPRRPLWAGPSEMQRLWQDIKPKLAALNSDGPDAAVWTFWIAWYDRVLAGQDIHAQAMHDVFVSLTEDDWNKGPAHINPKFDPVLALYAADIADIGEKIRRDTAGQIVLEPAPYAHADTLQTVLDKVVDAIAKLRPACGDAGNAMLAPLAEVLDDLTEALEGNANNWLRCHDEFGLCHAEIERLFTPEDIRAERMLFRLHNALSTGMLDLRETDSETKRVCRTRVNRRALDLDDKLKKGLRDHQAQIDPELSPYLAAEMQADLDIGLDESQPEQKRADAMKREGSRLIKIDNFKREELVKGAEDANKLMKAGGGIAGVIKEVWTWFF